MSVAVSNSPVFSPSSSLFCNKKTSIITPSPEALTLTLSHLKPSASSTSSSSSSSLSPSPSSPSSPFRLRLPKHNPSGISAVASASTTAPSSSSPNTILKRKRPTRLDIPVSSLSFGAPPGTPSSAAIREVVEDEREEYSVYCKRGRREAMEDRYSAAVNLHGDPKQVMKKKKVYFFFVFINLLSEIR